MENQKDNSILSGVIWKGLLLFFFPIALGTFFQQFYNTIDAIVVGRFVGKNALAAVGGSAAQIINLTVGFFTGLTSAATVVVSQFFGSGDRRKVSDCIHTIYGFSLLGSIIITLFGIIFAPTLLEAMNTPKELMPESILYLQVYFSGTLFIFIYNTGAAVLRALGDAKRPMIYLIVCCVVNILLDLLFVLVLRKGVLGVALATLIAQAISAILCTRALIISKDLCNFALKDIRIHFGMLKKQLYVGLPGGIQGSMYSLSNLILQSSVNMLGTDATAAWTAMGKLDAFYWMIGGSLGIAVTTFVGQNYGAGLMERLKKGVRIGLWMSIGFALFFTFILFVYRLPLLSIFTNDENVLQIAADAMAIIAPFYIAFTFIEIYSGALRATGDVIVPMIMTMLGICVFRITWVIFVVPLDHTMTTISINYPISWVLTSLCFIVRYRYWIKKLDAKK